MKLGISGTRMGMMTAQMKTLWELVEYDKYSAFHHGDCVGVDKEAHEAFRLFSPSTIITIHPPIDDKLRANCRGDVILLPHTYFARNRNIVNSVDEMIIIPFQNEWSERGGTWYTHDYALKRGVPLTVIWPDGTVDNSQTARPKAGQDKDNE